MTRWYIWCLRKLFFAFFFSCVKDTLFQPSVSPFFLFSFLYAWNSLRIKVTYIYRQILGVRGGGGQVPPSTSALALTITDQNPNSSSFGGAKNCSIHIHFVPRCIRRFPTSFILSCWLEFVYRYRFKVGRIKQYVWLYIWIDKAVKLMTFQSLMLFIII